MRNAMYITGAIVLASLFVAGILAIAAGLT